MFVCVIVVAVVCAGSALSVEDDTKCDIRNVRALFVRLVTTESSIITKLEEYKKTLLEEIERVQDSVPGAVDARITEKANYIDQLIHNITLYKGELNSVLTKTDGGWSKWSLWTECPVTCQSGLSKRTRLCNNPEPSTFGRGCTGNDEEVTLCNTIPCPDTDECIDHPCQNGATCFNTLSNYMCQCVTGYTGVNCEADIDDCVRDRCKNGATCIDGLSSYTCRCATGYTGTNCETNIDDCARHTCKNGGTCVDGVTSYTCKCVNGYTGTHCETNIDECVNHTCKNGATCVDGVSIYTCLCVTGYTGTSCETDIDDCVGHRCKNGAICVDGMSTYTCRCATGYTGADCDTVLPDCSNNTSSIYCNCTVECPHAEDEVMCGCRTGYSNEFVTIPKQELKGYTLLSPPIHGAEECKQLCINNTDCLNYELRRRDELCVLKYETPFTKPNAFVTTLVYDFYFRKCLCEN